MELVIRGGGFLGEGHFCSGGSPGLDVDFSERICPGQFLRGGVFRGGVCPEGGLSGGFLRGGGVVRPSLRR